MPPPPMRAPKRKGSPLQKSPVFGKKAKTTPAVRRPGSPTHDKDGRMLKRCIFGCKRLYPRIERHYTSAKHGCSRERANQMGRRSSLPSKTSTGRHRKVCPVPGCKRITSRLVAHLNNANIHPGLSSRQQERYRYMATNWVPPRVDPVSPTTALSPRVPRYPSARPRAIEIPAR